MYHYAIVAHGAYCCKHVGGIPVVTLSRNGNLCKRNPVVKLVRIRVFGFHVGTSHKNIKGIDVLRNIIQQKRHGAINPAAIAKLQLVFIVEIFGEVKAGESMNFE